MFIYFSQYTGKGSPNTMARVGDIFLCEFMGELARARVVSVSGEKARIFYVDYGNSEDTFMSQLLPLPSEMASIPVLVSGYGLSDCTLQTFFLFFSLFSVQIFLSILIMCGCTYFVFL